MRWVQKAKNSHVSQSKYINKLFWAIIPFQVYNSANQLATVQRVISIISPCSPEEYLCGDTCSAVGEGEDRFWSVNVKFGPVLIVVLIAYMAGLIYAFMICRLIVLLQPQFLAFLVALPILLTLSSQCLWCFPPLHPLRPGPRQVTIKASKQWSEINSPDH